MGVRSLAVALLVGCASGQGAPPAQPPAALSPAASAAPPEPAPEPEASASALHDPAPTMSWEPRSLGGPRTEGMLPRGRGRRIDIDVRDADLEDVCRLIADAAQVNIVVAEPGPSKVTAKLHNVPWDQALEVIVQAKGLRTEREGSVITVKK